MGSAPASWLMASMLKVAADGPEAPRPPLTRPSELPLYSTLRKEPEASAVVTSSEQSSASSVLLPPVRAVREQVQEAFRHTDSWKHAVADAYNETEARTAWLVKYLREEENKNQRYGAVVMGGLTGFVLGARGGIFRKMFYSAIGTSLMGAACFPEESERIAKDAVESGRHYLNVAYNFCYGVKPGDPQLEIKFPELSFPKDFSEFVDMSTKLASTAKQAIMPPPSKGDQGVAKSDTKAQS